MAEKEVIFSDKAPKAIGPYSLGIKIGPFIFTAGQAGIDPSTGELIPGGIEAETQQTLQNISNILKAAGASLQDVVKTTVFLKDIQDFTLMNSVYSTFFGAKPPARSTVQVAALPKNAAVEIEAVAVTPH